MQQIILDKLQPIFREVFDTPNLEIERSSSADTVAGWDSYAHINLIMAIEREFNIRFGLGELDQLTNVGELVDLMESKLNRPR